MMSSEQTKVFGLFPNKQPPPPPPTTIATTTPTPFPFLLPRPQSRGGENLFSLQSRAAPHDLTTGTCQSKCPSQQEVAIQDFCLIAEQYSFIFG